jgi:cell division protein FtsI/penicillin-binding protein 2
MNRVNRAGRAGGIPRRRVYFILLAFAVFMGSIGAKLVSYQVLRGADLGLSARQAHARDEPVPARRGVIYDSAGAALASTIQSDRVFAILERVADDQEFARALAGPLAMAPAEIVALLREGREKRQAWVQLKRHLSPAASDQVRALGLEAVVLDPEPRRVYPNGDFASQLLGFANWDLAGAYGVEGAYDAEIGGQPGHLVAERDVHGNVITVGGSRFDPPVNGYDAVLTINSAIQRSAEQQLEAVIKAQRAAGGTAIVMDVKTGAILALANRPSFDPNRFEQFDLDVFSDPAISALYEPGSTFKVLTMAIGLETGAVNTNTLFYDKPGYLVIDNKTIRNANDAVYGKETMSEILQHSSNLGAAFIAGRVGSETFYAKLREFGLGEVTGVDLQGEEEGLVLWDSAPDWRPINLTTNAFGQGITVTPLQMLTAVSAVVNGGRLMRPYVVQELRQDGRVVRRNEPQVVRQVISPQVSRAVVDMMTDVVDNVSYPYVGVPGYAVGSKSGTAQIPAAGGGYEPDDQTIGSLIGIGPSENPRFAVMVKIDRPKQDPLGGHIAGPPVRNILLDLFTLYGIPPTRKEP